MLWCHVKVARFRRMVRCLLGNVVAMGMVGELPVTSERLSENWVQRLLNPTGSIILVHVDSNTIKNFSLRRFDMPPTQVKLDNRHEPQHWIVDLGHWEEGLGVCHEACCCQNLLPKKLITGGYKAELTL